MQTRSALTRSQILAAAYTLFSTTGYASTGVAEICAAAGVSKGAFYHHFPSKQAVFLAILDEWLQGLDQSFLLARQEEQSVPQALTRMGGLAGSLMQAADVRLTILLEFWIQAARDPAIWPAAIAPYHRYTQVIAGLIRQGIEEGALRSVDPEQAARALVALALGLLMQGMFDHQTADWAQEVRQAVALFLAGIGKESDESDYRSDRAYWKRSGAPASSKWAGSKGPSFTR